jgi:hypothetical protein
MLVFATSGYLGSDWGLPGPERIKLFDPDGRMSRQLADIRQLSQADLQFKRAHGSIIALPADLKNREETLARIYRRFLLYTHHPDEGRILLAFAHMSPSRGDFNPRTFQYGGLFFYPLGTWYWILSKLGLCSLHGSLDRYLERPEEMGRLFQCGRIFVALFGTLTIPILWKLGCLLWGSKEGLLLAALWTLHPLAVNWSHEIKPYLPATVFVTLCIHYTLRYQKETRRRFLTLAALSGSLGVSTAPIVFPVMMFPLLAVAQTEKRFETKLRMAMLAGSLSLAAFLICNPYLLPFLKTWWNESRIHAEVTMAPTLDLYPYFLTSVLPQGVFPFLLPVALAGMWQVARGRYRWTLLAPAWMLAVLYILFTGGLIHFSNNVRFILPFLPLLLIFCVEGFGVLKRTLPRIHLPLTAACLLLMLGTSWTLLNRFRTDQGTTSTRLQASRWIQEHYGNRPILTVPASAAPWDFPPLPFKHYPHGKMNYGRSIAGEETDGPLLVMLQLWDRIEPPKGWKLIQEWPTPQQSFFATLYPVGICYAQATVQLFQNPKNLDLVGVTDGR